METVIAEMRELIEREAVVDRELRAAEERRDELRKEDQHLSGWIRKKCEGFEALGIEIEDWSVRKRCNKDRRERSTEREMRVMAP